MADKEWYTLNDLVLLLGVAYAKVRSAVFSLKNSGLITVRDSPQDARVQEVHRDSIPQIRRAVGLG